MLVTLSTFGTNVQTFAFVACGDSGVCTRPVVRLVGLNMKRLKTSQSPGVATTPSFSGRDDEDDDDDAPLSPMRRRPGSFDWLVLGILIALPT
jgi:hypothetical protein